jgi:glycosyltransferase 2 family protein
MGKKQNLAYAVVAALLAALVYVQFRTWRDFDWATFWSQTDQVRVIHILHAVGLIYFAYVLRAIRWKIFLRPVKPSVSSISLVSPTVIGFTGLALLGRPGEFIRPYLIARKEKLPFSSQLGVWAVERIFDIGAFAALMALGIFMPSAMRKTPHPEYYSRFREGGFLLVGLVVGLTVAAWLVNRWGDGVADWVEHRFADVGPGGKRWSQRIAERIREFGKGLHTIHGPGALFWLVVVSVGMWWIIAVSYHEVTIAYHQTGHVFGEDSLDIHLLQVLLLMGSSMLGSILQLPGVGGGSQLATIAALEHIFDVPKELAASCGIMLWLVTFVAIVPVGLLLAHLERLSLRKISEEAQQQEASAAIPSSPPAT